MRGGALIFAALVFFLAGSAAGAGFEIVPSVAVRQEYNDNIFFTEDDTESDYITTIIPGLDVENRTERANFSVRARLEPFFYWDNNDLDDIDHDYRTRLGFQLSPRLKLDADAGLRIDNRPDRDITATGLVFDTERRDRWHAGGGLGYQLTEVSAVNAAYAFDHDDFKGDEDEDFVGHTVTAGYAHNLGRYLRATTGRLNLGYGNYDYETSESWSAFASVGVQTALSEIFSLLVEAGARYVDSDFETFKLVPVGPGLFQVRQVEESDSSVGGIGSVSLRYQGLKTVWSLTLSQDLRTGSGTTGPSYLTRAAVNFDHRLLEKFSVGVAAGYSRNRADGDEFSASEIDEDAFYVRPRLRWEFWRNFTLEGAYSYRYVTDDVDDTDAAQHLVYAQLAYGYPLFELLEDLGGVGGGAATGGFPWHAPR